jgi:hypothetical protein
VTVIVPVVAPVPTLATASVNPPFDPAAKLPAWDLMMERSGDATVPIVAEVVDELFAALLSPVVATVAVLLMLPVAAAFTATVSVIFAATALAAMGPGLVQVTTWRTAEHVQLVPLPLTKVKLLLSVSLTVMAAVVGPAPALFTAIRKVAFCPGVKVPRTVFAMARSGAAAVPIGTLTVEELFAALLSSVVATVAVSLMPPVAAALTATVSVMGAAEALPMMGPGFAQVTS